MQETHGPGRRDSAIDVALFLLASLTAHGIDVGLRSAGLNPLPEISSGLLGVIAGLIAAHLQVRRRGQTWHQLGLRRPERWATLPLWVLGTMVALVVMQNVVLPPLAPLLGVPAPDFSKYDLLYRNLPAAALSVVTVWLTAAFPEELIYRGFVIDRFSRICGGGRAGLWAGVALQGVLFGCAHYEWGLGGVVFTSAMGALFGAIYVLAGRNLWPLILAHGILNSLSVVQFYFVLGSEITPGM